MEMTNAVCACLTAYKSFKARELEGQGFIARTHRFYGQAPAFSGVVQCGPERVDTTVEV